MCNKDNKKIMSTCTVIMKLPSVLFGEWEVSKEHVKLLTSVRIDNIFEPDGNMQSEQK